MPLPRLCLNMIVRNETTILERCLRSVADHIACWVIVDTGSTDGTQRMITDFFAARGIPGELHEAPFLNFSQARNEALDRAYASPMPFEYLLLTDADMELSVFDRNFAASLTEDAYVMLQRSVATYWNIRLVRREAGARYHGVTHEHLAIPSGQIKAFDKAWFIDHASGANRVNKYDRDIRLLKEALDADPEDARSWFYLAQCYAGAMRFAEAIEAYDKRIDMGGWAEEVWFARLQKARCILNTGDGTGFVREALTAFSERPHRAETLYELSKYYRAIGHHQEALACSEAGLSLSYPPNNDTLFIEDWVYDVGIRQEYAFAAGHALDAAQRERGRQLCEWLALSRNGRDGVQDAAHEAGALYADEATRALPSLVLSQLHTPPGLRAGPPSVLTAGDAIFVALGLRDTPAPQGILLQLDADLAVLAAHDIAGPAEGAQPHPGLDDLKLIAWRGDLWSLSNASAPDETGVPPIVLSRLSVQEGGIQAGEHRTLPSQLRHRGTLMPKVQDDALHLMLGIDPVRILDPESGEVATHPSPAVLSRCQGVSQLIAFDGGWLGLVRETSSHEAHRCSHRFVWFDGSMVPRRLSRRMYWINQAGDQAGGLAWHPDGKRLIVSIGAKGDAAWLGLVAAEDLRAALDSVTDIEASVRVAWPNAKPIATSVAGPNPLSARAASEAASVRSFDLFDTLVARRCVIPAGVFHQVEAESGYPDFTRLRMLAERGIAAGQYTLDAIYQAMVQHHGVTPADAERLKALEIETEHRNLFPIAEHCAEVGRDDIVVSDMYLPAEMLQRVIHRTCNLPGRRLVLTANGKHFGTVWPVIQASTRIREHLGDNPHADVASPRRAGIPARLTRVTDRYEVEAQLAEAGYEPLANLMREARLGTWLADPLLRRAQLAQFELNLPLLFLSTLHLLRLAQEKRWDHILFSGRDCYLWTFLYDGLRAILPDMPSATYFYTSRASRLRPSADYLKYFNQLRAGRRNVVVDLCGMGVSLRYLLAQSPEPETDIYLVHELLLPELMAPYEEAAQRADTAQRAAKRHWDIHSVFHRRPQKGDNDVLEELNRAPHPTVEDVRVTEDGFDPVFWGPTFKGEAEQLFNVHQAAFRRACTLLPTLSRPAMEAMLAIDPTPMILRIYDRLPGILPELHAFIYHKADEEERLVSVMDRAAAEAAETSLCNPIC